MADKTETTNQTNTTPSKLHFQCYPEQSASLWDTAKKSIKDIWDNWYTPE